jgi:hypothetical protein
MKDELTKIDAVSIESSKAGFTIRIQGKAARNLKRLAKAIRKTYCGDDSAVELLSQYFIDEIATLTDDELFAEKVGNIAELRGMSDEALSDVLNELDGFEADYPEGAVAD